MTIQQQNIHWGYWDWTSDCQPCDSLDADKDGDELLDGVELQVVVDQAHPVAMVRGACLGTRVTFYIFDAAEVDEGNNDNDDFYGAVCYNYADIDDGDDADDADDADEGNANVGQVAHCELYTTVSWGSQKSRSVVCSTYTCWLVVLEKIMTMVIKTAMSINDSYGETWLAQQ